MAHGRSRPRDAPHRAVDPRSRGCGAGDADTPSRLVFVDQLEELLDAGAPRRRTHALRRCSRGAGLRRAGNAPHRHAPYRLPREHRGPGRLEGTGPASAGDARTHDTGRASASNHHRAGAPTRGDGRGGSGRSPSSSLPEASRCRFSNSRSKRCGRSATRRRGRSPSPSSRPSEGSLTARFRGPRGRGRARAAPGRDSPRSTAHSSRPRHREAHAGGGGR